MVRVLASKDPKLVRTEDGTYVQLGRGVRVLVNRPGRPPDEEILKAYGLADAKVEKIERVADPHDKPTGFPRHKGGGVYVLSDDSTVRGKEDAEAAQAKLDAPAAPPVPPAAPAAGGGKKE